MDFSGDMGKWQRMMGSVAEGVDRRAHVFRALGPAPGASYLDVGCGGGHLAAELGAAVGDAGRVVGVDVSEDQLAPARVLCAETPQVAFQQADACDLRFEDGSFDGVASIQVLDYIPDWRAALGEMRRVCKPGGKIALVTVIWDHWKFYGPDPALTDRILTAFRAHCPHQNLAAELPAEIAAQGMTLAAHNSIGFVTLRLHERTLAFWGAKVAAAFATSQGVSQEDAADWLAQLDAADAEGRAMFTSMPVLTVAVRR